jgi:hypothetical protein
MITHTTYRDTGGPGKRWDHIRWRMISVVWLMLILMGSVSAQDFENHGTLTNRGLFRVKGSADNLPDTIGGAFDYKGADQVIPARTYRNLLLTGSGLKNSTPGNFVVRSLVSIDSSVILKVDTNSILKLQGNLNEKGYFSGNIENTQALSGTISNSDFGRIGASIMWSGTAPDTTTITRTSGYSIHANGNSSIQRFYKIVPRVNIGLDATFVFHYNNTELIGQNAAKLVLWNSTNNGTTWKAVGGTVDTLGKTITKAGLTSFGLLAAADSAHPLGAYRYATFLALASGNRQVGVINSRLAPFVVTILGGDSIPMAGEHVIFAITSMPAGATGGSISLTDAVTDINGHAACILTLGDKVGNYSVTATAVGLIGNPQVFTATAITGAPAYFAIASGNNQAQRVLTTLRIPFTVSMLDSGMNPLANVPVRFLIDQAPIGASGHYLSATVVPTDSNGQASVFLTLGNRRGNYTVTALAGNFPPVQFMAHALPGQRAFFALFNGDRQQARINSVLPAPFVVSVVDSFGNGIESVPVQFSISRSPAQASGQSLTVTTTQTDTNGLASTIFTLGDRTGLYTVTAASPQFAGNVVLFNATAKVGKPAVMALTSGNSQSGEILSTLPVPFSVTLADSGGNFVPGDTVQFRVTGAPAGSSAQWLSVSDGITDSAGNVSSFLTLGDKEGDYVVTISSHSLPGHQVEVSAHASVMLADANNDHAVNIADLTTLIDASNRKIILSQANFIRADMNADAVVDWKDVDTLAHGLLDGQFDGIRSAIAALSGDPALILKNGIPEINGITDSGSVSGEFENTPHGLRFNLSNSIAIRGIQIILRTRASVDINKMEIFSRAKFMQAPVLVTGEIVRIIAYNSNNTEIQPGSGSIVRLPITIDDISMFDVVGVIISDHNNHARIVPATKTTTVPGKYPESFALEQNYPNPFNMDTRIEYIVPDKTGKFVNILLQVFDLTGQKIKTLDKGDHEAGHYSVTWNGTNEEGNIVASGVYLVRYWWPNNMIVKKMLLTK